MQFIEHEVKRIANSYARFICKKIGVKLPPAGMWQPDLERLKESHISHLCQACSLGVCEL